MVGSGSTVAVAVRPGREGPMRFRHFSLQLARTIALGSVLASPYAFLQAQEPPPPPPLPPAGQALSPQQLEDLVAPIALYPDELVSQILVAATYPLEVVQAYQWAQRNPSVTGPALTQAVQQMNWDPSIQALVVFPDVMKRLNDDVTWTTNLGNAFLGQQADVMDAIQRLRQRAQQAGKLASSPQQRIITTAESGQPIIEIEPVDPAVIYVPAYDPVWIWGPPLYYPYPRWYWPRPYGAGVFIGFGGGISIGAFFGGGWGGWGGWGWHPGWGNHTVIVNNTFIHRYNFNTTNVTNLHGNSVWGHDAAHREGVPYANHDLQDRYRGNVRQNLGSSPTQQFRNNSAATPREQMGNRQVQQNQPQNHSAFGGMENGAAARVHADHGYSSLGSSRSGGSSPPPRGNPGGGGGGGRRH
jgi:hypothetical protein